MASKTTAIATATPADPPPPKTMPLRKATYVNVDKLVRSQYDIDLQRLTDELAMLKAPSQKEQHADDGGEGRDGRPSTPDTTKPNAWATNKNLNVLSGNRHHSKYHHQSRLQPPRDGFNLCV